MSWQALSSEFSAHSMARSTSILSNTSNWLLVKAPDLYLYGSLVHASPYLLDDQRLGMFASMYNSRLDSLSLESDKALHSGGPLVARTRKTYG